MRYRNFLSVVIITCSLLICGCSSDKGKVTIEGIQGKILSIDHDSILISDDTSRVDLRYTKDTIFEGKELNELVVDDKVKTWYSSEPLESYPIQATASRIEFIK